MKFKIFLLKKFKLSSFFRWTRLLLKVNISFVLLNKLFEIVLVSRIVSLLWKNSFLISNEVLYFCLCRYIYFSLFSKKYFVSLMISLFIVRLFYIVRLCKFFFISILKLWFQFLFVYIIFYIFIGYSDLTFRVNNIFNYFLFLCLRNSSLFYIFF